MPPSIPPWKETWQGKNRQHYLHILKQCFKVLNWFIFLYHTKINFLVSTDVLISLSTVLFKLIFSTTSFELKMQTLAYLLNLTHLCTHMQAHTHAYAHNNIHVHLKRTTDIFNCTKQLLGRSNCKLFIAIGKSFACKRTFMPTQW